MRALKVYRYRVDLYKIVQHDIVDQDAVREARLDSLERRLRERDQEDDHPPARLEQSLSRARRVVGDYALCNDFDLFATFTVSPEHYDRNGLGSWHKAFVQRLRDLRKSRGWNIQYVLVPERHPQGDGWHMHGLIKGLPLSALRPFGLDEHVPYAILDKIKAGQPVYDWTDYRDRFGYCDLEPIHNRDAVARYLVKYLSKSMDNTADALESGKHLYYASRGLSKPQRVTFETSIDDLDAAQECGMPSLFYYLPEGAKLDYEYEYEYGDVQWIKVEPSVSAPVSACDGCCSGCAACAFLAAFCESGC